MFQSLSLYVGAGALVIGLLGGWTVRDWKADSDALAVVAKGDKQRDLMQRIVDSASAKFEQYQVAAPAEMVRSHDTLREVYHDVKVPVECAVAPAAVSVLEGLRQRANAAASGELESVLPSTAPTPGPIGRPVTGGVGG